mmetsp:Transcript_38332/g.97085  ORF Transcript_38332/g.97085 Transcript_38332/m.97085 type:complete len:284 (+) Transcript_38332:392-1243(+)
MYLERFVGGVVGCCYAGLPAVSCAQSSADSFLGTCRRAISACSSSIDMSATDLLASGAEVVAASTEGAAAGADASSAGACPPHAAAAASARFFSMSGSSAIESLMELRLLAAASPASSPGSGALRGLGSGVEMPWKSRLISSSPISSSMVLFRSLETDASSWIVGCSERTALPRLLAASARPLGPNTTSATTPIITASGAPTPSREARTSTAAAARPPQCRRRAATTADSAPPPLYSEAAEPSEGRRARREAGAARIATRAAAIGAAADGPLAAGRRTATRRP